MMKVGDRFVLIRDLFLGKDDAIKKGEMGVAVQIRSSNSFTWEVRLDSGKELLLSEVEMGKVESEPHQGNPYPSTLVDEASGVEVMNDLFVAWKSGFEAGVSEAEKG